MYKLYQFHEMSVISLAAVATSEVDAIEVYCNKRSKQNYMHFVNEVLMELLANTISYYKNYN